MLWTLAALVAVMGAVAAVVAARSVREEIIALVRTIERTRAEMRPALVRVDTEAARARAGLERHTS